MHIKKLTDPFFRIRLQVTFTSLNKLFESAVMKYSSVTFLNQ